MRLEAGAMVTDTVRLVRKLGEGGMGSVWVAEHTKLESQVAVKFMSEALATDAASVARFSREASAAAQIKSPHVVQVFDHGVSDGVPYMVMELMEGEDLGARIGRSPLSVEDTDKVLRQTAKALAKAHTAGIVHRDIKPDNIFLTSSDEGEIFVKVLDFGVAKRATAEGFGVTSTGTMVGTPYYMSPEQMLSSKGVDSRADIWSLGVVVYHALSGVVPFDAETLGGLCVMVDRGVYKPITELRPDVPAAVDDWFKKALGPKPDDRFATVREMADAFTRAIAAGPRSTAFAEDWTVDQASLASKNIANARTAVDVAPTKPPTFSGSTTSSNVEQPIPSGARRLVIGAVGVVLASGTLIAIVAATSKPPPAATQPTAPVVTASAPAPPTAEPAGVPVIAPAISAATPTPSASVAADPKALSGPTKKTPSTGKGAKTPPPSDTPPPSTPKEQDRGF